VAGDSRTSVQGFPEEAVETTAKDLGPCRTGEYTQWAETVSFSWSGCLLHNCSTELISQAGEEGGFQVL
jgi:hypothetical protein